jgi:hypothetical protein
MTMLAASVLAHAATGSALASWKPFGAMVGVFALAVVALMLTNRRLSLARRVCAGVERVTGLPGWAGATVGVALSGLLLAGEGFYSDVAWHVALGRDEVLFTAPHTSIFVGLQLILASGACAVWLATATGVETRWRVGRLRVPCSALPLLALGGGAVAGFPLDEVWHRAYGIDVTMWSPTHLLMILGASCTGVAAWLVLAEAGVSPRDGRWARGVHLLAAALVVQGLSAPLGEFAFGVPQFQQLFHPALLCVAAGFAFVAARLVLGRGWAVGAAVASLALSLAVGGVDVVEAREAGLFIVPALAVEAAALAGTGRRLRFALLSAAGIGTAGLAGEWAWNAGAYQPWRASLLPEAVVLGVLGAAGAAVAAVAFASAFAVADAGAGAGGPPAARFGVPRWALASALLAVVAVVLLPLPRRVGDVHASIRVLPVPGPRAAARTVEVTVTPPEAAEGARWFQASAWQGGGLVVRELVQVGRGRYRSDGPVPVGGRWKALVRLHRGDELMTSPIYLPADPAIGADEIPAVDRSGPMEPETRYLLRETRRGGGWLRWCVHALLALAAAAWTAAFAAAVRGLSGGRVGDVTSPRVDGRVDARAG